MASRNDRQRNARRARGQSEVPQSSLYEAPAGEDEQRYPAALPCGCQIVQRLILARGAIVFFAIVWTMRDGFGNWQEQYSVDTGHGYLHEHTRGHRQSNDRRDIKPLYSQLDVQESFDIGYDRVQDHHDQHCRGEWR